MQIVDCSCQGFNPNCLICDGRGYYDIDYKEIHLKIDKTVYSYKSIADIKFEERIKRLSNEEIIKLISNMEGELEFENRRIKNAPKTKKRYTNSFRKNLLTRRLTIVKEYTRIAGIKKD
jgi:hypothetical protein